MKLSLRDYMSRDDAWGHDEGREVHNRLLNEVEKYPTEMIFRISLKNVKRTDASFPRESVVELARRFRGFKGFCLSDIEDEDLLDNWDAAANKRMQPLTVWTSQGKHFVIGPQPTAGEISMFEYVLSVPVAVTAQAAKALGLSIPNASNKLKQLFESGHILRRERVAASGGIEYEYLAVR